MQRRTILVSTLSAAVALTLPQVGEAQPQPATLDGVLARLSRIQGLHCTFREEKRIALLSSPVVSEGTIDYRRPGQMIRRVTRPTPQVVLIDRGSLRMSDGRSEQRIDLSSQPAVRAFVESFVHLLAGDRVALERTYSLGFERMGAGWRITLRPRGAPLDRLVRSLRLEGTGDQVTSLTLEETSGDVSTTTFRDVDTNRRFTDGEAARVFALRP